MPGPRRHNSPTPRITALLLLFVGGCSQAFGPIRSRTPETPDDAPEVVTESADATPYDKALKWAEQVPRLDDLYHQVREARHQPRYAATADVGQDPNTPATIAPPASQPAAIRHTKTASQTATAAVAPSQPEPPPAPPELERVSISPAPDDAVPVVESAASQAATVNQPVQTTRSPLALRELLRDWLNMPGGNSFRAQLDRRILLVLAGDYEAAREPVPDATPEQQTLAARLIEMLITVREARGADPAREAEKVLATLDQLREALVPAADLKITRLEVCRAVRGFGQFDRIDPPVFPARRTSELIAYIECQNFASQKTDGGQYVSRFGLRTEVLDADGRAVVRLIDENIEDRCATRRHDCFIPRLVRLPSSLRPGSYVLKVSLTDRIGHKVAEQATTIRVEVRAP